MHKVKENAETLAKARVGSKRGRGERKDEREMDGRGDIEDAGAGNQHG